jgi:hypothetical protein
MGLFVFSRFVFSCSSLFCSTSALDDAFGAIYLSKRISKGA